LICCELCYKEGSSELDSMRNLRNQLAHATHKSEPIAMDNSILYAKRVNWRDEFPKVTGVYDREPRMSIRSSERAQITMNRKSTS